jgi:integrase
MLNEFGAELLVHSDNPEIPSLTSSRIAEAIARRRAEKSHDEPITNATVNRTLTELLRRILLHVVNVWERPAHKVIWKDLLLDEPKERVRELRDHEQEKLWQNMRADYLPAIAFFIASGCRLKEVVTLRKDWFDWTERLLTIHGKGDKRRVIPISNEMAAIVRPLWDDHPVFVFTYVSRRVQRHPKSGKLIPKGNRFPLTSRA